jgi:hypothetical protein
MMNRLSRVVSALIMTLGWATPAVAGPIGPGGFSDGATLINFDDLAGGMSIDTGELITTQYAAQGVVFNNPNHDTRANASPIGSSAVTSSKPNVAFIFQQGGTLPPGPPQQLIFSVPVTRVGMQFFTGIFSTTVTLSVFDADGKQLETVTLEGTRLSGYAILEGFIGLEESTPIAKAEITANGPEGVPFNFAIDDLRFEATPEPGTITLLSIGIAAMAGYAWRRRKAVAV